MLSISAVLWIVRRSKLLYKCHLFWEIKHNCESPSQMTGVSGLSVKTPTESKVKSVQQGPRAEQYFKKLSRI